MSEKEKEEKNVDETLEFINKILDYDKDTQNIFHRASKVDKKNQNQRLKKAYQKNQNKNLINQFLNGCKCQKIDLIFYVYHIRIPQPEN